MSGATGVLDLTYLAEAADGDASFIESVILEFLDDTARQIVALQEACDSKDADRMRRAAHSVKGASANVGANRLSEVAFRLEEKGRTGDLSDVAELIAELGVEYQRLRDHVAQGTDSLLSTG